MLSIHTIPVTDFQQNARLLRCDRSGTCVCIDPGGDVAQILEVAKKNDWEISEIWLTHSHLDHCGGVAELKEKTGARLTGHPEEQTFRASVLDICGMYGLPAGAMRNCPEPDTYISGGEQLKLGELSFDVLFTPGHSPGHLCFYHPPSSTLIAGDTLFAGSIGRTDLPGSDPRVFGKTLREVIMALPDETKVLSGHGPDTTVGRERNSNPFLAGV